MNEILKIDPSLYETYREIRLGCLEFHTEVKPSSDIFWKDMDEVILPEVRRNIEGKEWADIPGVRGSRLAYKAFGRNPGRYRVSSEALLRRVRRGEELYHISNVVDVNNLISVESGLSVGSYDLDCIDLPITFRKAGKGEGYNGIGKDFLDMENMLVLPDDKGIFGSSMSDSTRAMVKDTTSHVLLVIYCFEDGIDLDALLKKAEEALRKYCAVQKLYSFILQGKPVYCSALRKS